MFGVGEVAYVCTQRTATRVRSPGRVRKGEVDGRLSGGAALVTMVQATDFRERHYGTFREGLNAS